jgi:hypothetical protein
MQAAAGLDVEGDGHACRVVPYTCARVGLPWRGIRQSVQKQKEKEKKGVEGGGGLW